jgi:hypothetical protein
MQMVMRHTGKGFLRQRDPQRKNAAKSAQQTLGARKCCAMHELLVWGSCIAASGPAMTAGLGRE